MLQALKQEKLKLALLLGTRIKAAAAELKMSGMTATRYYLRWKDEGVFPPEHKCQCSKSFNHKGTCPGSKWKRNEPQPGPQFIPEPGVHHTEGEWREMIVEIRPMLWKYSISKLRDKSKAEDIVSVTVLKCLQSRLLYNKGGNFKGWMFRCLNNNILSTYRGMKTSSIDDLEGPGLDAIVRPESSTDIALANEIIVHLARQVPEHRELCFAVWIDGISYSDAAKKYGLSLGNVKSKLWRAKDKLKGLLGELPET